MTRLLTAVVPFGVWVVLHAGGGARGPEVARALEAVVVEESFSGDSLGQFASYPPAQDVGYEPSLSPTARFDAAGGRALMRVVRPVVPGPLRIGFIREVRLVSGVDAELGFAYRLEPPALAGALELGLAGADGRRYVARRPASAGRWTSEKVRFTDFRETDGRPIRDGTAIDAFYVVADIAEATPDITCRFLLDDVRLMARREAGFEMKQPEARPIEPWREQPAAVMFRTGSTIAIEATPPVPLTRAAWSITGPAERIVARGTLKASRGTNGRESEIWSDASAYVIRDADPRGVWRLTLEGATTDGRLVETIVRLLVLPGLAPERPRVFFDADRADEIRARRDHGALAALTAQLRKAAATSRESGPIAHGGEVFARLDSEYLLPSLLGYFDVMNRARARIGHNAAVGFLDGDRAARDAARQALLDVAAWEPWAPPWFTAHGQHTYYPAGQLASAAALAYDLLHADLSADERARVRRVLMERSILPTWREYVLDNRIMADTSNWISHTVGGAILAAAAIIGDGTSEEERALALPLGGLLMKIEDHMHASFLRDGSYGEGISYLEFDLETLGPMLWAVERILGQSYWESTSVVESLRYPLHTLAEPVAESFDMGDTHPPAGHAVHPVAARSTDPAIRWYAERFDRRSIYDLFFFDDRVPPSPPAAPGSRLFRVKGDAVFRTGWDAGAGLVLFRAGPTFNHNHADQGSFQFRALGETFITEAGWSDYYKDPHYETYFTQAAGHNTLLVDGNPASQEIADTAQFPALDRYPRITDATLGVFYDAVGADLTAVYRGRLASYTRRLAYLKPDYLVVFDRVRTADRPARLTWRFHLPARSGVTIEGSGAGGMPTYAGSRAALAIRPLSSAETRVTLGAGHIPYPVFASRTPNTVPPQPALLDFTTAAPVDEAWFLGVFVPGRTIDEATAAAGRMQSIAAPGWAGVRVSNDTATDVVLFSTGDASRDTAWEGWHTDAAAMAATVDGGTVQRFGAQQVTRLRYHDRLLLETDRPVSAAIENSDRGLRGVVSAERAVRVRVGVPRAPARVTVNGQPAAAIHDPAAAAVSLDLPDGSHTLAISWNRD